MTGPILGNLSCCEGFFEQSEELALLSTDSFLMSEHLILSGPGTVSLLSPKSASVNSSSVIRSSFEPASFNFLSGPDCFPFIRIVLIALLDNALE